MAYPEKKVSQDQQQEASFQEIIPFSIKKINEDKHRFQASVNIKTMFYYKFVFLHLIS